MLQLGAYVNETFQAREGFSPDLFPPVPVLMGHYHKPHRVRDTLVRYVGSPYQGARCPRPVSLGTPASLFLREALSSSELCVPDIIIDIVGSGLMVAQTAMVSSIVMCKQHSVVCERG